ncbi:MAG: 1-deoxy-D-xylulose-5-phosphate reductoisomerase [Oscillospiraceae bacterium]|nr:1-deoxy-D-xylulose-5-phosphate reductoisomerase [Oscillospiraceae bacterium]
MIQSISVLGSTGSIGRQTLEVARHLGIQIAALTANRNIDLLAEQCRVFHPALAVIGSEADAEILRERLHGTGTRVLWGMEGLIAAAAMPETECVVTAVMGMVGLRPTLAAIDAGKRIALANKETLVCAGELVMARAEERHAEIIPVDSEHSAIFQCLAGCSDRKQVRKLILTASGGPFFGWSREDLAQVKAEQALKHPNWTMGAKITIDSATMMNKGLELIEAMRLYHLPMEQVQIVVHRQSIIHSLVEYCDGAVLAQLGAPDMRIPIQLALTWPDRQDSPAKDLDLLSCGALTFAAADEETFPCLKLARQAVQAGGTACAVLNGANEAAVSRYLRGDLGFYGVSDAVDAALEQIPVISNPDLDTILEADARARQIASAFGG